MDLVKGEVGRVDGFRIYQNQLGKSVIAAMLASMVSGFGMVYGNKHISAQRVFRRKTNARHMTTASDAEIRRWNENVTTRQVLRARIKPWKSQERRMMWDNRP